MGKWYWLLLRLITCIFLYCLLNVGRYSLLRVQSDAANSQKRTVNYKTAHRNRNIASFNYERRLIDEKFPSDKTNQKKDSDKINNFSPKFGPVFETGVWSERASNPNRIDLDDVYISVKTSKQFHETRLPIILDTWFEQARNQTFFFSDADDPILAGKTENHIINTGCNNSHKRRDLSCKMSAEYDGFIDSNKKWWCHFDDDNYVNIDRMVALLNRYEWIDDMYLGRPSLKEPFSITYEGKKEKLWFATGGAGFCISKPLAKKMAPWSRNGELENTSNLLRAPDDCTVGFIVTNRLGVKLTTSSLLHSHLESLYDVDFSTISEQVTLSYKLCETNTRNNVVNVPPSVFLRSNDPTRILSIHCHLNPSAAICR